MPASAPRLGLVGIFISTFFALVGYFMLVPFLLLRLKSADVSTAVAGAFAAMAWFGVFRDDTVRVGSDPQTRPA